jgi:hypothetical protein
MVQAYTGSDSIIVPAVGERFMIMGGNISGEFTELVSVFFFSFWKHLVVNFYKKSQTFEYCGNSLMSTML